jgi:DNA invertase Pin-like site-specific DNA recombinase
MTARAVLYARVCVDNGQNLAEQLETCRQHTRQHDWHVVEELAERGASGSSLERPQLNRALEMARTGGVGILIVHDPYRLSREWTSLQPVVVGRREQTNVKHRRQKR